MEVLVRPTGFEPAFSPAGSVGLERSPQGTKTLQSGRYQAIKEETQVSCIFRPSESKETVGVSPPSREKQVQVHGRESTGVLFGKKWQRNAS